ncbi:hypothetical protein SERLA73DRAFT_71712 [Serpula lacrymans var. lacrymans S7.3]|uniref:Uncharacterized protein n=2 Tax=Serpula lacrymans var. lacrymans TaxID=341189 RepID=F8PSC1_SERL3|nr:uncharacterized protein SERLADRAFT_436098 [Serpula lacrymans var. lacrymans S7.9]EGO00734.1 hypothetical protein SERLA73DRAFT_71712 [Serpula lacrymans var. lacrymans S7.3]EGO26277.1 hypothetical protein SERLADRAFT_436098 [Serpula lacrymans var. lacrymans S7.9]
MSIGSIFMRYKWGLAPGHVYARNTPLEEREQPHAKMVPTLTETLNEEEIGLVDDAELTNVGEDSGNSVDSNGKDDTDKL